MQQPAGRRTILARAFSRRNAPWWAIVLLPPALAFATYWPYIDSYFANDDWHLMRGVKAGNFFQAMGRAFTFPPFTEFTGPTPFFRPMTDVAYKLLYDYAGLHPEPYHITNIVSHSLVAMALGVLVARLAQSPLAGLAAAALFVTWPSYESNVVWISTFSDLFCAAFGMAALVVLHLYLTCDRAAAPRWLALAAVLMMAAAFSKQTATIYFALIPLLVWAEPGRRRTGRELLQAAAVIGVVLAVAVGFWTYEQLYEAGIENVAQYRISRLTRYEAYLRHLIWPFRGPPRSQRVLEIAYLALGACLVAKRRQPHAFFFLWSLIAAFPYAFTAGPEQPRYTYQAALPFWGLLATLGRDALAWAARWDDRRLARLLPPATLALVASVVFLAARETRRTEVFIESQARASRVLVDAIRRDCGEVPPGATIYVIGSGVLDPFGTNNRSLVNVLFDKVYYRPVKQPQAVQPPDCFIDLRPKPGP